MDYFSKENTATIKDAFTKSRLKGVLREETFIVLQDYLTPVKATKEEVKKIENYIKKIENEFISELSQPYLRKPLRTKKPIIFKKNL